MGPSPPPQKGAEPLPNVLRVEVGNFENGLTVIANFVALEQQIILVKTRSETV